MWVVAVSAEPYFPTVTARAVCDVCGHGTTVRCDGHARHVACAILGRPHPTIGPADGCTRSCCADLSGHDAPPSSPESTDDSATAVGPSPTDPPPGGSAAPAQAVTGAGPSPGRPDGWRAAAAVFDPSGVYLPDGQRYDLPEAAGLVEILQAALRMRLGHPSGVGALILTDELCERLGLALTVPDGIAGQPAREWMRDALAAEGERWLAEVRAEGWEIERLAAETRVRRTLADRQHDGAEHQVQRAFDLVLAGYVWSVDGSDRHLTLDWTGDDDDLTTARVCVEIARRYGRAAELLGVTWQGTPRQMGLRIASQVQRGRTKAAKTAGGGRDRAGRDRARVVTLPGPRPVTEGWTWPGPEPEPETQWARVPAERELRAARWVHFFDRRAAYLAQIGGASVPYLTEEQPELVHLVGREAVLAAIEGVWTDAPAGTVPAGWFRAALPAWTDPLMPPPHPLMTHSEQARSAVGVSAPTLQMLITSDDPHGSWPGAGYPLDQLLDEQAEAWVAPASAPLLKPWAARIGEAVKTTERDGDAPLQRAVKAVYAGFYGGLGREAQLKGKQPHWYQPLWRDHFRGAARSTMWRRLLQARHRGGPAPIAVYIDEVAYLSADPDPASVEPMADAGLVGQLRHKPGRSRALDDAASDQLAAGSSVFRLLGDHRPTDDPTIADAPEVDPAVGGEG